MVKMLSSKSYYFLFVLFGFLSINLFAQTNYYVDYTGGEDDNPGTEAQPWKTVEKVNSVIFSPGDHIKFKRGESWSGFVYPNASGSEIHGYIVYEAYGTGAAPILANPNYGVIIDGRKYLVFRDFEIISDMGIIIKDESGNNNTEHIKILNNSIHGTSIPPAYTYGNGCVNISQGAHHITISGNEMYNHFFPVWFGDEAGCNSVVSNNIIHDCSGCGIGLDEVFCTDTTQIIISNNTIYNCSWHGMEISANHIIIENNIVHHCGTSGHSGIHLFSRYEISDPDKGGDFNIIRGNVCYQIHDHEPDGMRTDGNGIQADQWCDSNFIYNNIAYDNDGAGIIIFGSCGNRVYNNTMYNNGLDEGIRYGQYEFVICRDDDSPSDNNVVKNNIGITQKKNHFAAAIDEISVDGNNSFSNNIWYNKQNEGDVGIISFDTHSTESVSLETWNGYSWAENEISSDPMFVDTTSKNFHLKYGSPAINTGLQVSLTYDNENNPRPLEGYYDRGAFEHGKYWKGTSGTLWDVRANWNDSIIPVDTSQVTIPHPDFYINPPEIISNVVLKKLFLNDSATISVLQGVTLRVSD
jgi:parallel beta-helix repeat protein